MRTVDKIIKNLVEAGYRPEGDYETSLEFLRNGVPFELNVGFDVESDISGTGITRVYLVGVTYMDRNVPVEKFERSLSPSDARRLEREMQAAAQRHLNNSEEDYWASVGEDIG